MSQTDINKLYHNAIEKSIDLLKKLYNIRTGEREWGGVSKNRAPRLLQSDVFGGIMKEKATRMSADES